MISGITPKLGGLNSGAHVVVVKNSLKLTSLKNSIDGTISAMTMPIVVPIDTRAQSKSMPWIESSPYRGDDRERSELQIFGRAHLGGFHLQFLFTNASRSGYDVAPASPTSSSICFLAGGCCSSVSGTNRACSAISVWLAM